MHVRTPTIDSTPLRRRLQRDVWLKLECVQPPGSFKIRGVGRLCRRGVEAGATQIVTSSGGNAGLAAAYAGRRLGVPVLVVVPTTTPAHVRARIEAEGAIVEVHGDVWDEAHAVAVQRASTRSVLVHPFDHPDLWSGHSTLVDELAEDSPFDSIRPGVVVVTVGGGGLLCGVLEGMHRVGWEDVPVLAVETPGAASFAAALAHGSPVDIGAITSVARCLGARTVCSEAVRWAGRHDVRSVLVEDDRALAACRAFADDHRLRVEPACGAGLAVAYDGHPALLETSGPVAIVVCGGALVEA